MGATPSEEEIIDAIKASGYLMEQEVATTLEGLGLHVETNRAFKDLEEGKSREMDVWAIHRVHHDEGRKIAVFAEIICECKNSTNPFAFLTRVKNAADNNQIPEEILFPKKHFNEPIPGKPNSARVIPMFRYLDLNSQHYRFTSTQKAVQFAKIVRDKASWSANHAGLYDAIFYPMVKALLSRRKEANEHTGDWQYIWLFFPLVVTSGELYTIDTMQPDPVAVKVNHVSFTRDIKGSKIDGVFTIDFVTQDSVAEFWINKALPFISHMKDLVSAKPELFTK